MYVGSSMYTFHLPGKVTKTKHKWHKVVGGQELMTTGLTVQVLIAPQYLIRLI